MIIIIELNRETVNVNIKCKWNVKYCKVFHDTAGVSLIGAWYNINGA